MTRGLSLEKQLSDRKYSSVLSVVGKHSDQRQLVRKEGLYVQVRVHHQGTSGQDIKQEPWKEAACWLALWLDLLPSIIQDDLTKEWNPHVGSHHQLILQTVPRRHSSHSNLIKTTTQLCLFS